MTYSAPTIVIPSKQQFAWAPELSAPGTVGTTPTIEGCNSIASALQRDVYNTPEYWGVPTEGTAQEETTKYTQITMTMPWRKDGFPAYALAALMGVGAEATPATTHVLTPSVITTRCPTFSIWHDTGVASSGDTMQMRWATVTSVALSYAPNSALSATITLWALAPDYVDVTTPTYLGSGTTKLTRTMGYQGSFHIFSGAGTQYPNKVLTGDMTVSRTLEALFSSESQTVVDFAPGALTFAGNCTFVYDGIAAGSVMRDYLDFNQVGSATNPNNIKFTDKDGDFLMMASYPWKWNAYNLDNSGQVLKGAASFSTNDDESKIASATPTITSIQTLTIKNSTATKLLV